MYMCSRRLYLLPEVSGCPNLGSKYEDKKKKVAMITLYDRVRFTHLSDLANKVATGN